MEPQRERGGEIKRWRGRERWSHKERERGRDKEMDL
jgi:hypothetical protein